MLTDTKTRTQSIRNSFRVREEWWGAGNKHHVDDGRKAYFFTVNRSFTDTRTTDVDPTRRWRELVRLHRNSTTFLTGTHYSWKEPQAFAIASWKATVGSTKKVPQYCHVWGAIPTWPDANPPDPSSYSDSLADSRARVLYLNKVADKRRSFQGLSFIGELGQTVRMLKHPYEGLTKGLGKYVKGFKKIPRGSSAAQINRAISGAWLETVYGLRPFMGDLDNIGQALGRITDKYEDTYQRFFARADGEILDLQGVNSYTSTASGFNFGHSYRKQGQVSVQYYGQVGVAASSSDSLHHSELGLTLNEFVPTMWELLPYSFLADYASNIGNVINAASTRSGDVAWISKTIIRNAWTESWVTNIDFCNNFTLASVLPSSISDSSINAYVGPPFKLNRRHVYRTPLTSPPGVGFSDLHFKVPVGSLHWLNIGALFAQSRGVEKFLRNL